MDNRQRLIVPPIGNISGDNADDIINAIEECGVRQTIDCLDWGDRFPYHPLTTFSLAHSNDMLYIDFFVRSNYLRAVNDCPNSPVYEDSCVGVYMQPDINNESYISVMINCIGTLRVMSHQPGKEAEYVSPEKFAGISCFASCGNRPFIELEGLFTWDILVEIPLSFLGLEPGVFPITIRGNFYKCASGTSQPHFLSWAPINSPDPDFNRPDCFGIIELL